MCLMMICGTSAVNAGDIANKAFWTDANGVSLKQLELSSGDETVIRLNAEVPAGKTLKAYSLVVMYENDKLAVGKVVGSAGSAMPPMNINSDKAGSVVANAFNVAGIKGSDGEKTAVAILELPVKAISGVSHISVLFSAFGAGADDEFKPAVEPLKIMVK